MQKKLFLLFIAIILLTQEISAATLSGRPSRIISGDRLMLTIANNRHIQVQLMGIQAPPLNTRLGRAARKRLSTLVAGHPVTVEYQTMNNQGQPLGKVLLGNSDINLRLLSEGLAIHQPNSQSALDNDLYSKAMQQAKELKRGIWAVSK